MLVNKQKGGKKRKLTTYFYHHYFKLSIFERIADLERILCVRKKKHHSMFSRSRHYLNYFIQYVFSIINSFLIRVKNNWYQTENRLIL